MIQKSSLGEKLRQMREAEGLSRREMSEITGVSPNNLKNYEILGRQIPADTLILILKIERFRKYTDWLMFNQINLAVGQVAPSLSPDGSESSEGAQVSIKTTQRSHH
ncbi:helix-turn-helix transcriptional regulator [Citrobacter freundii]|uniref:helix-turn-helix domain-containing protein n=1 Tax=Citrobacter freundii TaxID=546 RepID=UPI00155E7E13|nr:helix-turn-helix transcriptional regulator [Citrobacter freundii]MEB1020373.1 helix-turn-helix transcriptional regulator [Citrobacter freundii]MEB1033198.1 helix-turn-helix transcriptional regulator [Citrobacter freundii]NGF64383.1 helix-turn-helix transcriptional regulator [Citrobacter freundii]UMB66147.1 helix-turn-helix domain-containing protein [Citrobacter freundii]WIJ22042.1 helix-turn-helix transcriptional regulator [Citrobacter freundii]